MNLKYILIGLLLSALIVVAGCGVTPGESLAGQARSTGRSNAEKSYQANAQESYIADYQNKEDANTQEKYKLNEKVGEDKCKSFKSGYTFAGTGTFPLKDYVDGFFPSTYCKQLMGSSSAYAVGLILGIHEYYFSDVDCTIPVRIQTDSHVISINELTKDPILYKGCHQSSKWNGNVYNKEDVSRIVLTCCI